MRSIILYFKNLMAILASISKNEKFDADPFIVELAENDEIAAAYATFEL